MMSVLQVALRANERPIHFDELRSMAPLAPVAVGVLMGIPEVEVKAIVMLFVVALVREVGSSIVAHRVVGYI